MPLSDWLENHRTDYEAVSDRLAAVNGTVQFGTIHESAEILEKSYMFAVLSIKTERDRHENAFVGHYTGDLSRKDAALETVYGGHKKNWIADTFESVNWVDFASAVRYHAQNCNWEQLLEVTVSNLKGVSYRKASFMLAMVGFTEYMCIDSNVGRYAGIEADTEFYCAESYMNECREIYDDIDSELSPFLIQWAIYDFERGEHARHMVFFNELPY